MCLADEFFPVCGTKVKLTKPNWDEWSREFFKILHQCVNRNCKNFGRAFIYEHFDFGFPDSSRTIHCNEHNVTAEMVEAYKRV
jgi:hypothetical protein